MSIALSRKHKRGDKMQKLALSNRRGNMLAMAFVFVIFHMLILYGVQQRLTMMSIVERQIPAEDTLPKPGSLVLTRALEDIREGSVSDGEDKDYDVKQSGVTYTYSVAFTDNTTHWAIEITPPDTLPEEHKFDRNVSWP